MRSILTQTRQADEIIIVDDGSTDGTARILQDFRDQPGLRVITLAQNMGFSMAINAGLNECYGAWITRLDADDWWDSDHLETLELGLSAAHENTCLVAVRARYWNETGREIGESNGPLEGDALRCQMMHDNPFVHSAVMFRLDAARAVGGYPSGVRWEDYRLWIMLMRTFNARILDATTVNCRKRAGSLSSVSKIVALEDRFEMQCLAWREFWRTCPVTGSLRLVMAWTRVSFAAIRRRLPF